MRIKTIEWDGKTLERVTSLETYLSIVWACEGMRVEKWGKVNERGRVQHSHWRAVRGNAVGESSNEHDAMANCDHMLAQAKLVEP
jgi:hypothetical protein